jgi:hypothetical protein
MNPVGRQEQSRLCLVEDCIERAMSGGFAADRIDDTIGTTRGACRSVRQSAARQRSWLSH